MKVLSIVANPRAVEDSASLQIERAFIDALKARRPAFQFERVNVYNEQVPLLDKDFLPIFFGGAPSSTELALRLKRHHALLEQFISADLLVIASPMWNFSVPPMLKAYIDNILVAGKTFQYTEQGPQGMLKGKRAVLCLASGGVYQGSLAGYDHLSTYLRTVLAFMGITDVTVIWAQGQALGAESARAARDEAIQKARELAATI